MFEGGKVLEYLDPAWWAARAQGDTARMQALSAEWTGREVAGLKVVAVTGTGILVTLATGGTGLIPYAAGVSAATAASIGLDAHIRQAVAEGRVLDATDRASYHLPFVGTSGNIYDAYQQGAVLGMGFHMGLLGVAAFGVQGALRGSYRLPQGAVKQEGKATANVTKGAKPVLNAVNTGKKTGSAAYKSLNVDDAQHFFSNIVDNYASQATKFGLKSGDGVVRDLYQISGSLRGKPGVFEWIVEGSKVTHRRFIPGGVVNGIPNQIVR